MTGRVDIPDGEWALLASVNSQVQCLGSQEILIMESETKPTDKSVYTILLPQKIYTYIKTGAESLWGYCDQDAEVSVTAI